MEIELSPYRVEESWSRDQETISRSEVWRWSRIIWLCPGGMEDRKVTAVMAIWQYHREET